MFAQVLNEKEKQCFRELLVIMSSIDGDFSMDEMMHLDTCLSEMGVTTLPASIRPLNDIVVELKDSQEKAIKAIFFELALLSRIDSKVHRTESALLKNLAEQLNVSLETLSLIEKTADEMPSDPDKVSALLGI